MAPFTGSGCSFNDITLTMTGCVTNATNVSEEWDTSVPGPGGGGVPNAEPGQSLPDAIKDFLGLGADDASKTGTFLFRGMEPDPNGGPAPGASARTLGARPGVDPGDIPVGDDGTVEPNTGGMSVNESPRGAPPYRRPSGFGGTGKGINMFCISDCDLGPGLRYTPDPDQPGHGFVEPSSKMPFKDYQSLLQGTQPNWWEAQP